MNGGGPVYVKAHGRVVYFESDLEKYAAKYRIKSTAEERAA
jgi:ribosomal protein L24E